MKAFQSSLFSSHPLRLEVGSKATAAEYPLPPLFAKRFCFMWYILAATYVALASLWAITADVMDILPLAQLRTPMSLLTATLVMALSLSAVIAQNSMRRAVRIGICTILSLVALIGVAVALRPVFGWNLSLEHKLADLLGVAGETSIRSMPPASGIAALLSALSLILIASSLIGSRARKIAQRLAAFLVLWTLLCGGAMASGWPLWFQTFTPVAPATVAAFLLLGIGAWIIATQPRHRVERHSLSPWLITLLVAVIAGAFTAQHIREHKQKDKKATHALLTAICDLKFEQIANWQKERLNDAQLLGSSHIASDIISALLTTHAHETQEAIHQVIATLLASENFDSVSILDSTLKNQLTIGPANFTPVSTQRSEMDEAIAARSARMSDIWWDPLAHAPRIDVFMPVFARNPSDQLIALLQFSADPRHTLFRALADWPIPTETGEALLCRREQNEVVVLHAAQEGVEFDSTLRLPMDDFPNSPAVRAIRGMESNTVALDYRGVSVLFASRAIPETRWHLVAKVSAAEALEPIRQHAVTAAWFVALLALAAGMGAHLLQARREIFTRQALASEVARRHLLTSQSRDGIVIMDTQGAVIEANEAFAKMLGYSVQQVANFHLWDWDAQMERNELERRIANPAQGGEIFETRHRRADGAVIEVEISASSAVIEGRQLVLAICRDITERKRQRAELAERERRFRTLFDLSPLGIVLSDLEGTILDVNRSFCAIHGMKREDFLHKNLQMLIPPDAHPSRNADLIAMRNGATLRHEMAHTTPQGQVANLSIVERAISLPNNTVGILGFVEDITIRKQAEQDLRSSEERFRSTFDLMEDGAIIVGFDERVLYANEVIARQVALTADTIVGKRMDEVTPELDKSPLFARIRECLHRRKSERIENTYTGADGVTRYYALTVQPVPEGIFMLSVDITEQRAQQDLIKLQSTALNAAANSIVITDTHGIIEWANDAFCRAAGFTFSEVVGKNQRDIVKSDKQKDDFYRNLWGTILSGKIWHGEIVNRRRDGSLFTEEMTITPVKNAAGEIQHFVAIKQDLTAQKQLEEQLLRTQRLESVGRLASGIAHDLNNTLAPILLSPALLREGITDPTLVEIINSIEASATRGASIIRQLLAFSRGLEPKRTPLQIRSVVAEATKLLQSSLPKSIALHTVLPEAPIWVNADVTQLHQVLMNLCINARDAMPNGGDLHIEVAAANVDKALAQQHEGVKPGAFALLTVRDSGVGISSENIKLMFDPFFTTKAVGEGTGLGLSSVLGIVRSHKGFVEVSSEPGHGAEFRVYLPIYLDRSSEQPKNLAVETDLQGHGEAVLVVDDEEGIRKLACRILEKNGYRTLEAENGQVALAVMQEHAAEISFLLTDMLMPVMDGQTLIRTLRDAKTTIRIISMSGYLSDPTAIVSGNAAADLFIPKPFTPKTLSQALRSVRASAKRS